MAEKILGDSTSTWPITHLQPGCLSMGRYLAAQLRFKFRQVLRQGSGERALEIR